MAATKKNFNDEYKLYKILGTGAFATVYKCKNKKTSQQFAAKVIMKNFAMTVTKADGTKEKDMAFDIELRINQALHHPNIVNLNDVFELPKLTLIFDLCKGGDLLDDIEKREFYSQKVAAESIVQVLKGVSYINSQNIIHRDLKPENLLLTEDGTIKVADFGLAVEVENTNGEAGGLAGSPDYMAPEVLQKKRYTAKVDAWSCGVIAFIFLFGYPPFEDDNAAINVDLEFPEDEEYGQINQNSVKCIKNMLTYNPKVRFSCDDALRSDWLRDVSKIEDTDMGHTLTKLQDFNARRKLKGAIKAVMAGNKMALLNAISKNKPAAASGSATTSPISVAPNSTVSQQAQQVAAEQIRKEEKSENQQSTKKNGLFNCCSS